MTEKEYLEKCWELRGLLFDIGDYLERKLGKEQKDDKDTDTE